MNLNKDIFSSNAQLIVNQLVGEKKNLAPTFKVSAQTIGNWVNGRPSIEFLRWLEQKTGHDLATLYEIPLSLSTMIKVKSNNPLVLKEPAPPPIRK